MNDIKYGIRSLLKRPGFTLIIIITLALGIGANTAIFSVVNAVLLQPLKFHQPERLVMIWEDASFAGFPRNTPAPANYADWKTQNNSFTDMAAIAHRSFNLTGDGEPELVQAQAVTANFFSLLGVQPLIGRTFMNEEDRSEAHKVVILSYSLWQSRYGGELSLLGREILLSGEKHTVVGVLPASFQFLDHLVRMWVPIALDQEELRSRGAHYLTVVGRLKPGVEPAQAQADIETLMKRIGQDYPQHTFAGKLGAVVVPLREQISGDSRRPLLVLLVAVGFVLLIACANVASLMLWRAASRRREIAVRAALGAGRFRIVRQILTESVLLASCGGLLGVLLAVWSFEFLKRLVPPEMTLTVMLKPDSSLLLFALSVSVVTAIVSGLAPAFQASQFDLNEGLKQSGSRVTTGSSRLRRTMVVFEVALSLVLLVGAGLLIQTLFRLHKQYSILEPEKILTVRTRLPRDKYPEHQQRTVFYEQVLEQVENLPGVVAVGYTTSVPLAWKGGTSGFFPEGTKEPIPGVSYDANHRQVSANYLKAMGIPLLEGRYFDERDTAQSLPVAIVNETMARQYWPGESALNRRFKVGDPDEDVPWFIVVGIAADVRQMGLAEPVKAEMYLPYQQVRSHVWFAPRDMAIRTDGEAYDLVAGVRAAVRAVDPNQPVSSISTMAELLGEETAQRQTGMILLASFAVLALLLSSLGIYGLLAYFVVEHTSEIGVRLALGATPKSIIGLVLKKGMSLTLLGVVMGLAASLALTQLMASLLFGVQAMDLFTFGAVTLLLTCVALIACWLPAKRAAKTDPLVALRYE